MENYRFGNHKFEDDPLEDLIADFKYEGQKIGAVEMLLIHDTQKDEYYRVYIHAGDDKAEKLKEYNNPADNQTIVREVTI